ncbi:hypothetical protein RHSIM_Rhsim12G0065500 [Rhododendron simsii]|uniref:Uncharacterized protein n=1 Tax=Rhododendron simsii TaxID=118357 RepID=A0A834G4R5_RHOSS|nr:hypothetical protein RHSIM_Rhsim12G0065500 [Rhododendron simsii]
MAAATQSRFNNLKNTKVHCDYCDIDGHTITNCRTRLYHCNHCDKDGHTDEFCRKLHGNGSTGGRDNQKIVRGLDSRKGQRQSFSSSGRANTTSHPTAHAAQFKQRTTEAAPTNSSDQPAHFNFSDQNILNGLTPDQYQQLAAAVSMVKSQSSSNAYANAAAPDIPEPFNSTMSSSPSPSPTVLPATAFSQQPTPPHILSPIADPSSPETTSTHASAPLIISQPDPLPIRQSTRQKQVPAWQKDYHMLNTTFTRADSLPPAPSASRASGVGYSTDHDDYSMPTGNGNILLPNFMEAAGLGDMLFDSSNQLYPSIAGENSSMVAGTCCGNLEENKNY